MLQKRKTNKKTKTNKKNIFKINLAFLVLFAVIGTGYLVVINSITSKGYQIEKIESKIADLRSNFRDLSVDLSYKQSMNNVLANVSQLGMVEADKIDYISAPSTMVFNR